MDYKKAYEDMVQRARELHEAGNALTKKQMEIVCPELTISDDEKIRNTLIDYFSCMHGDYYGELKKTDIIDWLVKHGEPLNNDEYHTVKVKTLDRLYAAEKELEELKKKRARIPKFRVGDIIISKKHEAWEKERRITAIDENGYNFDLVEGYGGGFIGFAFEDDYELVTPKPAEKLSKEEYVKKFKALCDAYEIKLPNRECDIYGLCKDLQDIQKPADYDHEMWKNCEVNFEGGKKEVIDNPEKYGLCKPAEWSAKDKRILQGILLHLEGEEWVRNHGELINLHEWQDWLKLLPERFNLQPKQEWSEEDERTINKLCDIIAANAKNGYLGGYYAPDLVSELKSLRPQPNSQPNINHTIWHNASEEKPTKLPIIHIWYHGNRFCAVDAHENIGLQAELGDINFQPDDKWAYVEDLLNAQPHWKPSEEQMRYLLAVINEPNNAGSESCHLALKSLYNDLKKPM